jgi:dTDP-4-dehydrorhamnose reductase
VLLTGVSGQLGQALIAARSEGINLIACSRAELDLVDPEACQAAVRELRPDWVLNAGAFTAVDRAESEPDLAWAINAGAPAAFAEALANTGGRLLQISTDFVFDGCQGSPYRPEQQPSPLGVYGTTKAAGERAVLEALPPGRGLVLRTSWLYGPVGSNFCRTMLRLHRLRAAAGETLQVVADQVGCPTSTAGLAAACWRVIKGFRCEPAQR